MFFTFIGVILSFCVSSFVCFGFYIYLKYFYLRKIRITKIDKEKIKEYIIILLTVIAFFGVVLIQMKYHFINFEDPKDYSFKILTLSSITYGLLQFGLNSSSASKKIYLGEDIIKYIFLDSRVIKFLFTKVYKLLFLFIVFSAIFYNELNLLPIEDLIVFSKYNEVIIKMSDFMESLWFIAIVFMILLICLTLFKGISFIKIMFKINNNRTGNIERIIANEKIKELKNNLLENLYIGDLKYFFNTVIFNLKGLTSSEKNKYLSFVNYSFNFINDDPLLENIIYYYSLQKYDGNTIELFLRFTIIEFGNLIHKGAIEIDFLEMDELFLGLINCFHDFITELNQFEEIDSNFMDELIEMYSIIENILYKISLIIFKEDNEREDFLRKNLYTDKNKNSFWSNLYKQKYDDTISKLLELTSSIDQIQTIFVMLLKSPLCLSSSNHNDSFLDVIENENRAKDIIDKILQLCENRGYSDQDITKIFTLNNELSEYDCDIIDMYILEYCYSWNFKKNYYVLYKSVLNKSEYNVKTKFILYLFLETYRGDRHCNIKLDIEFLRKCMISTKNFYGLSINSIASEVKAYILSSNIGYRFKETDLDKLINWIANPISSRNIIEIYNFKDLRFGELLILKYILDSSSTITLDYYDFECIISLENSQNKAVNTINYFIDDKHLRLLENKYVLKILFYYGKLFKKLFLKDKSLLYQHQYDFRFYIILNKHFSNKELICMENEMGFYNSEFIKYIILKLSDDEYNQFLENDKFKGKILDGAYHLISSENLDVFSYVEKLFDDYSKYSSFIDLTPLAKGKVIRILMEIIH